MHLRFSIAQVRKRGYGLGNELIPWARALLAAQLLGAHFLPPAFGLNRRRYWRHFGTPRYDWLRNRTLQREVMGASSYLSVCDFRLLLGTGDAAAIDELTIYWPGRAPQTIKGLAAGKYYRVVEGQEPQAFVPGEKKIEP